MSNYPRIHPREMVVNKATRELQDQLLKVIQEHELTEGEQLRVVADVYANWVSGMAKYMIRDERHGDPHKCGGLAYPEEKKEFDVEGFCKDSVPPPPMEKKDEPG